jgi:hypothetical protein
MRVIIERHGGFAGIAKCTTLDTETLSETDRAKVQSLIEEAGLFSPGELAGQIAGMPDRFRYSITVVADDGVSRTSQFGESELPRAVQELIELARENSGQTETQRREG